MRQFYQNGVEVIFGDRVRQKDDEGRIIALENQLADWGLSPDEAGGRVMIEWEKMGLVCEFTETNEDLDFVARAVP